MTATGRRQWRDSEFAQFRLPERWKVRLRPRATAIVIRNGLVLLARNRGLSHYSLPGGGIRIGETVGEAVARELHAELKLTAARVARLLDCDFDGSGNRHHVCLVEADGEPVRRRIELGSYMWWDMKAAVPVLPHVNAILERLGCVEVASLQESGGGPFAARFE